jgi:hypothetical protein
MVADATLGIHEVERRPVLIAERPPDRVLAVDRHRCHLHVLDGLANVVEVLFELELRRVDADHHRPPALVLVGPRARVSVQPVDAGIGPEVDENDFAQARSWAAAC